jgi:hypothetical protein
MASTISRTTFTFEVLHRTNDAPHTLDDAFNEIERGHAIGGPQRAVTAEVPDTEVPETLVDDFGNDGEFFDDDLGVGTEHTWVTFPETDDSTDSTEETR